MISKVFSSSLPYFKLITKPPLFLFSDAGIRGDQNVENQVTKAESWTNMKDLLQYLNKNKADLMDFELRNVCEKVNWLRNTHNPWQNLSILTIKLKNVNIKQCDINTLSHIAGMASLLNQNDGFNIKFFISVSERIKQILQLNDKLYDEQILKFLDLACELNQQELIENLNKLLLERMKNLKVKDFHKYLHIVQRKKLATRSDKEVFNKFILKVSNQFEMYDVRTIITLYKYLKNLNRKIYNYGDMVKQIQNKLQQSLDDLNQKDIHLLANFKSSNNIFNKMIYNRLMDAMCESGDIDIETTSVFKILTKLSENEDLRLYGGDRQTKFMKFLAKNLDKISYIIFLIKKNFFSRQQLVKLNQIISESEYAKKYEKSHSFIYELVSRGIFNNDNYQTFLETVKAENPKGIFTQKYLSSALIVDRLHSKNPQNAQIKDLLTHFKKTSENFKQNQNLLRNVHSIHNNKLIEHFHRRFGSNFIKHLVDNLIANNEKLSSSFLQYLIFANDVKSFFRIMKFKNNNIEFYTIRPILQKINNHPTSSIGLFQLINKILENLEVKGSYQRYIINYLCNWEVHLLLAPEEIQSFLGFARKVFMELRPFHLNELLSYFIRSPSHSIKSHALYGQLLNDIQNKQIAQGQKQDQNERNNSNILLGIQLMRLNRMNTQYATKLLQKYPQDSVLKQYCELVTGKNLDWKIFEAKTGNLILVAKANQITDEQIDKLLPQIKKVISKSTIMDLENYLINFEFKRSKKTFEMLNIFIDAYHEKIVVSRQNFKIGLVLENLQKFNLKTNQYKNLLSKILEYYVKNMNNLSSDLFAKLLDQCVCNGVQTEEYVKKLISYFESKMIRGEISISKILPLFENLLLAAPNQTLYTFLLKSGQINYYSNKILPIIHFINTEDEKLVRATLKFLQNLDEEDYIHEGVFRYLVAKNPAFAELEGKIKLAPVNQSAIFREKLIKFMQQNNIPFEQKEKYGHHLLKVDSNYLTFMKKNFNPLLDAKLKDYFGILFEIPTDQQQNIKTIFLGSKSSTKHISHFLGDQIQAFKEHKESLEQILKERIVRESQGSEENVQSEKPRRQNQRKQRQSSSKKVEEESEKKE